MIDRKMTLWSDGLLSKYGFNDGDEPDDVADWLEADGISYGDIPWHPVLRRLVREHLLPVLDQTVVVYDIGTNHNPIRAESVDGVPTPVTYDRDPQAGPRLTPAFVEVPYSAILAVVREELAAPAADPEEKPE